MAENTDNDAEAKALQEAAEKRAAVERDEQARRYALTHADDRPIVTVAALAPANRPIDGEVRVVRPPEVRGDVEDFTDPAAGLESEISDVEGLRRTLGPEKGEAVAAAVVAGNVTEDTPAEAVLPAAKETVEAVNTGEGAEDAETPAPKPRRTRTS